MLKCKVIAARVLRNNYWVTQQLQQYNSQSAKSPIYLSNSPSKPISDPKGNLPYHSTSHPDIQGSKPTKWFQVGQDKFCRIWQIFLQKNLIWKKLNKIYFWSANSFRLKNAQKTSESDKMKFLQEIKNLWPSDDKIQLTSLWETYLQKKKIERECISRYLGAFQEGTRQELITLKWWLPKKSEKLRKTELKRWSDTYPLLDGRDDDVTQSFRSQGAELWSQNGGSLSTKWRRQDHGSCATLYLHEKTTLENFSAATVLTDDFRTAEATVKNDAPQWRQSLPTLSVKSREDRAERSQSWR